MVDKSPEKIQKMFDKISEKYDFLNNLMSFGTQIFIKKDCINQLNVEKPCRILDLCCGTGDLTRILRSKYKCAEVFGVDFSEKMIEAARKLSAAKNEEEQRAGRQEGISEVWRAGGLDVRQYNKSNIDKTSQAQQTDKLAYPPLEGGSKSLISGWCNLSDKNLSTLQPFNHSTNDSPSPQPSPSRGEGACHEGLSTLRPFNSSTDNGLSSYPTTIQPSNINPPPQPSPSRGEGACHDNLSTLQPFNFSTKNNLAAQPPSCLAALSTSTTSITYLQADATNIPFPDNFFDILTIGFGLRNIEDFDGTLNEIYRVLKPNGEFLHLDFGEKNILNKIFDKITPNLVKFFTKNSQAYSYLIKSKQEFFTPEELIKKFENKGFKFVKRKDHILGSISCQIMQKLK